jgi:hypothetical protein
MTEIAGMEIHGQICGSAAMDSTRRQGHSPVLAKHAVVVVLSIVSHAMKVALCGLQKVIAQASVPAMDEEICFGN